MDVNELFETQIPIGPEHKPMTERIAIGRRALRRRRAASVGAASVAVVAVVGTIGAVVNIGDLRSDRDNPPASSTSSPTAGATYTPPPPDEELTNAIPVATWPGQCTDSPEPGPTEFPCWEDMLRQGREGVIRRREGVQISQRVDDPVDDPSIEDGVALEATYKGKTQWIFLANGEGGGTLKGDPVLGQTFEEWAAELTPVVDPEHRFPEIKDAEGVTRVGPAWYDDDKLVIREDAEVLERIDDPLDSNGKSVALAAKIDGVEWWWLMSGSPAYHEKFQYAGSGDFRAWVDAQVRDIYGNELGLSFNQAGKVESDGRMFKVVDQITDHDLDWFTEPGEQSALVQVRGMHFGPESDSYILVRTRNHVFEGAIEVMQQIGVRVRKDDTLQTVLARLQEQDFS